MQVTMLLYPSTAKTTAQGKEFLEAAEQLRKIIPTKYRRFDLDNMAWLVQHRAVKHLEKFLSQFPESDIDRREELPPQSDNRIRAVIKEKAKIAQSECR